MIRINKKTVIMSFAVFICGTIYTPTHSVTLRTTLTQATERLSNTSLVSVLSQQLKHTQQTHTFLMIQKVMHILTQWLISLNHTLFDSVDIAPLFQGVCLDKMDTNRKTALLRACQANNLGKATCLVQAGADVNCADGYHQETPLMSAVKNNNCALAALLIAANAEVNRVNSMGESALTMATSRQYRELVEVLLAAQGNVNHQTYFKSTPLSIATARDDSALIERLILAGADVNQTDGDGNTALVQAIQKEDLMLTRLFLQQPMMIRTIRNKQGKSAFDIAQEKNNPAFINVLRGRNP